MKENKTIKTQLEDLKMTLQINKDLLFKYIQQGKGNNDNQVLLNELRDENNRLTERINLHFNEKTTLEKKVK
jgi:hypothetical protein